MATMITTITRSALSLPATAPAVIARGSTTTTTAVGCMNANKHTQRAAVSRMGYPMIGKPTTPTQRNYPIPFRVVTVLDETCLSGNQPQAERSPTVVFAMRSGFFSLLAPHSH